LGSEAGACARAATAAMATAPVIKSTLPMFSIIASALGRGL
jgi:hypothetical protein